jgi:arsenate reductase
VTAHWSFPDPAAFAGSETEQRGVFLEVLRQIRNRIDLFLNLPLTRLDRLAIKREVDAIGRQHG